jgi:hypothetical protein
VKRALIACLSALIACALAGCAGLRRPQSQPTSSLQCVDLIHSTWDSTEQAFGYDAENPWNTRYKLSTDAAGIIFILDTYKNRVAVFDQGGRFESYATVYPNPEPPRSGKEQIWDIAPGIGGRFFAAIGEPVTITRAGRVETQTAYTSIYLFSNGNGTEPYASKVVVREDMEQIRQDILAGGHLQHPFSMVVAGRDGSMYSLRLHGGVIQYPPESASRVLYDLYWQKVIVGWDSLLYILGQGRWQAKDVLLAYEPLNGHLVRRTPVEDLSFVSEGGRLRSLVGVDTTGRLYFGTTEIDVLWRMSVIQSDVYILSNGGNLERHVTIPGRLAHVDEAGRLYVFAHDRLNIPHGTFLVKRCSFTR